MSSNDIRAGIDVGTNAIKGVVARVENGRIVEILREERRVTRLGEGVHASSHLSSVAMARACEAIAAIARTARDLGAREIRAGATSAAREAANVGDLARCVRERCGVCLEVLSGEEEARLTYLAVQAAFEGDASLAVVDPGGGSTEWALGRGKHISALFSAPVGAVRVTETWLPGDPPAPDALRRARREIERILVAAPEATGRRLAGTGGTLLNLASVHQRHTGLAWPEARDLPLHEVERQIEAYAAAPLDERRGIPGLEPARADIILGGALVVAGCYHHARAQTLRVTEYGLRHGLVIHNG